MLHLNDTAAPAPDEGARPGRPTRRDESAPTTPCAAAVRGIACSARIRGIDVARLCDEHKQAFGVAWLREAYVRP